MTEAAQMSNQVPRQDGQQDPGNRAPVSPAVHVPVGSGLTVLALVAGAFLCSFFSYYSYRAKGSGLSLMCSNLDRAPAQYRSDFEAACHGVTTNAWHGLFGWVAALLCGFVALSIVVATVRSRPLPVVTYPTGIVSALFVASFFVSLAFFQIPPGSYRGRTIDSTASTIAAGHGWAYWAALVMTILAWRRAVSDRRRALADDIIS